jgi:hypothetical protein
MNQLGSLLQLKSCYDTYARTEMDMLPQKEQIIFPVVFSLHLGEIEGHETTFLDWQQLFDGPPQSFPYY